MKDMKPKRDPLEVVSHSDESVRETETIKGPSPNFPKLEVETISPVSKVQKDGFKWKSGDDQNTDQGSPTNEGHHKDK